MKRKIFSKLLMGAFLIASVSAFVSCKDYDDDINANKAEIKAVQDQLSTLTSNLNSLQTELQTQKTALQQELATAKSQLETQIADAKAQLTTAIEKKADQSNVDALASKVATLESNLAALNAAYEAKMSAIDSAIASLQAIIEKKADISYVDNAIAILNSAIDGKVAKDDFGAFKGEVNNLKNDLNNLSALVETKADKKDIDHAVENINAKLADLIEQMKITVPQTEIANIQKTIEALQNSVNALTQAVAAKAEQSAVDQLNAFYKELKEQVNTLVTPEQLASAIQTLKEEVATKGAEESARLEGLIAQVQKAVDENKAAGEKALKDAVEEINTALGTKASVDDLEKAVSDFNAAKKAIEEDIATKYAAVTGDIEKANKLINQINEALTAEIAKKADLADFNKFKKDFANLKLDERLIACEALIEQVAAINAYLGKLEKGATLAKTLEDLQKVMSQDAADKVKKETEDRVKAIEEVNTEIAKLQTNLNKQIADLNKKLYGEGEVSGDIDKLQADTKQLTEDFSKIDQKIQDGIEANLSNLSVFVTKMLTSVTLIPGLYIDGIEAIEFKTLVYTPQKVVGDYDQTWHGTKYKVNIEDITGAKEVRLDNKLTTALYRLSPKNVDTESFDINNLEIVSNVAKSVPTVTRATVGPEAKSLVAVDKAEVEKVGSEKHLKVYLKKTDNQTKLEGDLAENQIRTISLKVPRAAGYVLDEDAPSDVYSEYSRIVETIFTPKIAALPFNNKHNTHGYKEHYSSYNEIYGSLIDAQPALDRVTKEVYYKDDLDLLTLVTGDYDATKNAAAHTQITKEELKEYGLAFRFFIPTDAYNDVTHKTDQQQFAKLSGAIGKDGKPLNNILSSKLPDNPIYGNDNEATVGKEPIIGVQLVDTANNYKLVDHRYLKIKWVNKKLADVEIDPVTNNFTLGCDDKTASLTWKHVINNIYGKIKDENGNIVGMSQSRFEQNYPIAKMKWSPVSDNQYKSDVAKYISKDAQIALGTALDGLSPIYDNTTNENGDAILASWTISTDEIGTIGANGREFKVKIFFESVDPGRYPNLYFFWTVKYTLPTYTAYIAHNTINWAEDNENIMWIYPVQYGTSTASAKVKYEYNLMASFTRPASGKNLWVVRDLNGECPAWDIQFSIKPQQDVLSTIADLKNYDVAYHRAHNTWNQPLKPYKWTTSYSWDEAFGVGNTTEQTTETAYLFYNQNGAEVLKVTWGGSHPTNSWAGEKGTNAATPAEATLTAVNSVVYPLLNPLDDDNENDLITPKKTHSKLVKMNVWGKLNQWNYYEVSRSPFYLALVEPLRVNANIDDYFVDNIAGGSRIGVAEGLTMTDFAGYFVRKKAYTAAEIAAAPKVGTKESSKKWAAELYKYYGISGIKWSTTEVTYGLKLDGSNNLVADNSINVSNAVNGKSAAWVTSTTSGGVDPSITYDSATDELVFLNLGGQHVGFDYNVFIPVDVTYELGTLRRWVKVVVHPAGYGK